MIKIGVLGAGTWGIALARILSNAGHAVTVWSAIEKEITDLSISRKHPNLKDMQIPQNIVFEKDIAQAVSQKDILLFAVPSPFVRSTAKAAAPFIPDGQIIVDVAKGIEADTLMTMTRIIESQLPGKHPRLVAFSGPTHAEEVAKDLPTTIVSASTDPAAAEYVQEVFHNTCMRVYTNPDILGVELCGAAKNVIALAAGIAAGLGYGDNTKAALMTRGMAEITRLGLAMGCAPETFFGLAGIGDLIVTATSRHSRNNRCGMLLGQGVPAGEAVKQIGMVVEGINALPALIRLQKQYSVDMPIVEAIDAVVNHGTSPADAVKMLMDRGRKSELSVSEFESKGIS